MDWIFNILDSTVFLIVVVLLVITIPILHTLHVFNFYRALLENTSEKNFPSSFNVGLAAEVLFSLLDRTQGLSLTQLKNGLPHISASDHEWRTAIESLEVAHLVQRLSAIPTSTGQPSIDESRFELSTAGRDSLLEEGITPTFAERAGREFYRFSEGFYREFRTTWGALLATKNAPRQEMTAQDICDLVLACLAKMKSAFIDSYARPLVTGSLHVTRWRDSWLIHKLRACWSGEFVRARKYVIENCNSQRRSESEVLEALERFDQSAVLLEKSTWNEVRILVLSEIKTADNNALSDILARLATGSAARPIDWFRELVNASDLPPEFKQEVNNRWRGNTRSDALQLINWADSHRVNPQNSEFTTFGAILGAVLDSDIGIDAAQSIVAYIVKYGMYHDAAMKRLHQRYGVPNLRPLREGANAIGPWLGPEPPSDDLELQGFFQRQPDYLDVGFLERCMERAASVCRIEIPLGNPVGTGFLIAEDKLLTNFHVLKVRDSDNLEDRARKAILRFRNVSAADGREAEGQIFRTAGPNPVLATSPACELDFVLLRVDPGIKANQSIRAAPFDPAVLMAGTALNIVQHPSGGAMSVAFSKDGIRGVFADRGLVQYVTLATGGSSGSPCFNDDWNVVAIHHAARARSFGSVREGILMSTLHPIIKPFL
jgi:V8-like Glu-specific endopeptidase